MDRKGRNSRGYFALLKLIPEKEKRIISKITEEKSKGLNFIG
jgi:hypothetical protein